MTTKAELITIFRKENEDLTLANMRKAIKGKYGTVELVVGDNPVTLPSEFPEEIYENATDYDVDFVEAIDGDGIDIKEAISVINKTTTSFVAVSPTTGTLRWKTQLKIPNYYYHT